MAELLTTFMLAFIISAVFDLCNTIIDVIVITDFINTVDQDKPSASEPAGSIHSERRSLTSAVYFTNCIMLT